LNKIDVRNSNLLEDDDKNYRMSRKFRSGFVTGALIIGIPAFMFGVVDKIHNTVDTNKATSEYTQPYTEDPINVSLNEINEMNIIFNNSECSEKFMENIYTKLDNDGIKYNVSKKNNNIDVDNSVVITLDQLYMSGPNTLVIAPYENDRLGNSDALAIAANTAFYEKGFLTSDIECGIRGFREHDGEILERVPTKTEERINKDKNTSFVTISFGTANMNTDLVAEALENMLVRYYSYINSSNIYDDLIYRTTKNDDLKSLAKKYETTENHLKLMNKLDSDKILENTTIKNPKIDNIREFNNNVPTNLYVQKTKWSK